MAKALARTRPRSLRTMTLAEAPDLLTAIAAGEAHGLTPAKALTAAFGKWLTENADEITRYGLANIGKKRAMVNYSALARLLTIMVVEQGKEIAALRQEVGRKRVGGTPNVSAGL